MNAMNWNSIPRWLGLIVVLQVLILLSQWGAGPAATPAMAQIPDAGEQRLQIIDQLKTSNQKLDSLLDLLKSGELQVKGIKPDDTKGHD